MDTTDQLILDSTMSANFAQMMDRERKRTIYSNPAKRSEIQSLSYNRDKLSELELTKGQAALTVQSVNSNSIWSVFERDKLIGLIGFVHLNNLGLYHYLNGSFDFNEPDPACLVNSSKAASANVFWFVSGKTRSIYGLVDILTWLRSDKNRQIDIWAQSANERELAFLKSLGFQRYDHVLPGLLRFKRSKASLQH